jgi:hypothetical protein
MPARKLRQILDAIRQVHHLLAARYHELRDRATDERIQLLLEDIEWRERKLEHCIARYETDADQKLPETWLQFVPEDVLHIEDLTGRLNQPTSLGELVEETLRIDRALTEAYLAMANEAPTSALQDLFTDLATIEQRNDRHYAKAVADEW